MKRSAAATVAAALALSVGGALAVILAAPLNCALAQGGTKTAQCLYSGPLAAMTHRDGGPPVRFDVEAGGRSLRYIHKVQTNYSVSDPFKAPIYAEQPTCRVKLDCTVSTDGLVSVVVQISDLGAGGIQPNKNEWTRIGDPVAVKYADAARNATCHIVGLEML